MAVWKDWNGSYFSNSQTKHLKTFGTDFIILIGGPVFANVLIFVERLLYDTGFSVVRFAA